MTENEFNRLQKLAEKGLATEEDLKQLEPYRAKRAILLAAGIGERLKPITINAPKPLVKVNGVRMIDTLINACIGAGIKDIYVVCGYLAEQFDVLKYKYPMIKFIHNPTPALQNDAGSIASAWMARDFFENAYICDADLVVFNPKIIRKYNYHSNVLGIPTKQCDDWCLTPTCHEFVDEEVFGGSDCYKMVGIYYWTKDDAKLLAEDIHQTFTARSGGRNLSWELVPNDIYHGKYQVKIIPCKESDVVEIDTCEELKAIDPAYRKVGGE